MAAQLFHYLVEGKGPKPFMQVVVVRAASDEVARLAVAEYLRAEGLDLLAYDEEETAIVDEGRIPPGWRRPGNDFGVVAASGRIWCDEDL